jgi:Holliday junction resolvase RusA-like endonuclease
VITDDALFALPTPVRHHDREALWIPGTPRTQGSMKFLPNKHGAGGRAVYPQETILARNNVTHAIRQWWCQPPLMGAVWIELAFYFERPLSHYGTGRNAGALRRSSPKWHSGHKDADKLSRLILDAATDARLWGDDSQVARLSAVKLWAKPGADPGILLRVGCLEVA